MSSPQGELNWSNIYPWMAIADWMVRKDLKRWHLCRDVNDKKEQLLQMPRAGIAPQPEGLNVEDKERVAWKDV